MNNFKFLPVFLVLIFCGGTTTFAQTGNNIFDSRVFDWRFYVNSYSDLLQNSINTPEEARQHWQIFGVSECRQAHPGFHTRQYLDIYADVRNAYGANNCNGALNHYLTFGYNEGRRGYVEGGAAGQYGRWTVQNDIIYVSTSTRQAGAVDSLWWSGKEFINAWDHGRELQVALSVTPFGEAYNPTEAGNCSDGIGATSTSILEGLYASGNQLATQSIPAFWHPANGSCGEAVNTSDVSNYRFNKNVQVGYAGLRHAIQFLTQVHVPENVSTGLVIEAPTGYLAGDLTSFYTYDPTTRTLTQLPETLPPGEQGLPLIFASQDGNYAMGCWSPQLPLAEYPNLGYGQFRFITPSNPANSTVKWNIVFRTGSVAAGTTLGFRSFIFVGNLENVRVSMDQLYEKWRAGKI